LNLFLSKLPPLTNYITDSVSPLDSTTESVILVVGGRVLIKKNFISPIHLKWAKLFKEHIAQQENDGDNITLIVDCLNNESKKDVNTRFGTAGFVDAYKPDSCFSFT
jgi:hypothetical protein